MVQYTKTMCIELQQKTTGKLATGDVICYQEPNGPIALSIRHWPNLTFSFLSMLLIVSRVTVDDNFFKLTLNSKDSHRVNSATTLSNQQKSMIVLISILTWRTLRCVGKNLNFYYFKYSWSDVFGLAQVVITFLLVLVKSIDWNGSWGGNDSFEWCNSVTGNSHSSILHALGFCTSLYEGGVSTLHVSELDCRRSGCKQSNRDTAIGFSWWSPIDMLAECRPIYT